MLRSGGGGGGVTEAALAALGVPQTVSATLTMADYAQSDTVPFVVIPAPGANKVVWPKSGIAFLKYNGVTHEAVVQFSSNSGFWWDTVDFGGVGGLMQDLFDRIVDASGSGGMRKESVLGVPGVIVNDGSLTTPASPLPALEDLVNQPFVFMTEDASDEIPDVGGSCDSVQINSTYNGGFGFAVNDTFEIDPPVVGVQSKATGVIDSVVAGVAGAIVTHALSAGGTGYAPGDTGTVLFGDSSATYVVDTVNGGGAVLTYHLIGASNSGFAGVYSTETGGGQPGVGTGFTINVSAVGGQVLTYHLTSTPDFGYEVGSDNGVVTTTSGGGQGLEFDILTSTPADNPVTITFLMEYVTLSVPT